jgi:hypothetical protein
MLGFAVQAPDVAEAMELRQKAAALISTEQLCSQIVSLST